jgi:hypothetical protein
LTLDVVEALRKAFKRGVLRMAVSLDLGRTTQEVMPGEDGFWLGGVPYAFPERVRERTVYHFEQGVWTPVSRFSTALYKLVPTEWGPPTFEIDGIKMLVSQKVSPLDDAHAKVGLVEVEGIDVLDTCAGLGYFAVAALERGARRIQSFEISPEVRWLRTINPWSPSVDPRLALTAGSVLDHLPRLPDRSFGAILHDPPRFGIAGELYALEVYVQFARLLTPRGRLFHYVGTPNRLTSGRDVPAEVSRRLRAAGFRRITPHGDGLLAQLR